MDQQHQQQQQTHPPVESSTRVSQDAASALQTQELLNSLLLQGAFGTVAPPEEEPTTEEEPPTEEVFVNKGLAIWESKRQEWLLHRNASIRAPQHAKNLDVDEVIDTLFASSRPDALPKYFSTSIPLPQMIDILQDLWEAEGLET